MPHYRVVVRQDFNQPVETLFELLSDHQRLRQVLGVPVSRIREGAQSPNGVGSIRRIGPWPFGLQETVTALRPPERIDYRISRFGGPIRKHRGSLLFEETGQGSRVTWTIEFDALPVIGKLVSQVLERGLGRGLARYAARP